MKKKAQVIMLPTDKASDILINTYINETHSTSKFVMGMTKEALDETSVKAVEDRGYKYQHLYITTDDEMKEGDWCYSEEGILGQHIFHYIEKSSRFNGKKIIATTDTELTHPYIQPKDERVLSNNEKKGLPQPSKTFIEKYCKVGGIDEVLVEYEEPVSPLKMRGSNSGKAGALAIKQAIFGFQLKVNSHNEIIIHPIMEELKSCPFCGVKPVIQKTVTVVIVI
jgi:hypothetical protein